MQQPSRQVLALAIPNHVLPAKLTRRANDVDALLRIFFHCYLAPTNQAQKDRPSLP